TRAISSSIPFARCAIIGPTWAWRISGRTSVGRGRKKRSNGGRVRMVVVDPGPRPSNVGYVGWGVGRGRGVGGLATFRTTFQFSVLARPCIPVSHLDGHC